MLTRERRISLGHALGEGAGSAVAFCLAVTVIWPVGALLAYHMRVRVFSSVDQPRKLTELGLASLS
jgi:palmitoyltransferase ZDHHC9/14/18